MAAEHSALATHGGLPAEKRAAHRPHSEGENPGLCLVPVMAQVGPQNLTEGDADRHLAKPTWMLVWTFLGKCGCKPLEKLFSPTFHEFTKHGGEPWGTVIEPPMKSFGSLISPLPSLGAMKHGVYRVQRPEGRAARFCETRSPARGQVTNCQA